MRVALVQMSLSMRGRSENLTRCVRALVAAAEADPAPDLVVLPAGCDGPRRAEVSPAMVHGFAESLAAVSREWGIYTAAGFLHFGGSGLVEAARLYDPDGDRIALCAAGSGPASCPVCVTPFGRIGVALACGEEIGPEGAEDCEGLIVTGRWSARQEDLASLRESLRDRFGALARRLAVPVCLAGPVSESCGGEMLAGGTAVFDRDGRCLAEAAAAVPDILFQEILVPDTPRRAEEAPAG